MAINMPPPGATTTANPYALARPALKRQSTSFVNDNFRRQLQQIKSKVRRWERERWLIVDPDRLWLKYWDILRSSCVFILTVASPVEVTMRKQFELSFIVMIGFVFNGIFFLDMVLTFNRSYRAPRHQGGREVYNRKLIARRYLRGWFFIDLLSTIPYDLPLVVLASNGVDVDTVLRQTIRLTSLCKLLRGLKLVPVFHQIIFFLTHRIRVTFAVAEILRLAVLMLFLVHYLACMWTYVGLHFSPGPVGISVGETTWIDKYGMSSYAESGYTHRLYAVATFVSITAVFGGVSSVSPNNYYEYIVLSLMMLCGGLVWAYILSSLCGIFSSLNPHEAAYKNQMDALAYFCEVQRLPRPFRKRLRDFFHQTQDYARAEGFDELFLRMSDQLRSETAQLVARDSLSRIWYFTSTNSRWSVEPDYLGSVALFLRPAVYEINETIHMDRLTVISRGQVWQGIKISTSGSVLGMDAIIDERYRSMRNLAAAHCLSFVQVSAISRAQLFALAETYPKAKAALTRAGRYLVVKAAIIQYYRKFVKGDEPEPARKRIGDTIMNAVASRALRGVLPGFALSAPKGASGAELDGATDVVEGQEERRELDKAYYEQFHNNKMSGGAPLMKRQQTSMPEALARANNRGALHRHQRSKSRSHLDTPHEAGADLASVERSNGQAKLVTRLEDVHELEEGLTSSPTRVRVRVRKEGTRRRRTVQAEEAPVTDVERNDMSA